MKKLVYWILNFINNEKHCHSFCPCCAYFRQCKEDGEGGMVKRYRLSEEK